MSSFWVSLLMLWVILYVYFVLDKKDDKNEDKQEPPESEEK